MSVVSLPYPKTNFNVPELVMGDYDEWVPMAPLMPSFAEYLIDESGPPEVVVRYVDARKNQPRFAEEYCVMVFMPPLKSQACIIQVCRQDPVEGGENEHHHDYYQIPYDEIPIRLEYHMRCANAEGGLLPFVAEVNNVQLRDAFHENAVEAWSRYHYSMCENTSEISVEPWSAHTN